MFNIVTIYQSRKIINQTHEVLAYNSNQHNLKCILLYIHNHCFTHISYFGLNKIFFKGFGAKVMCASDERKYPRVLGSMLRSCGRIARLFL